MFAARKHTVLPAGNWLRRGSRFARHLVLLSCLAPVISLPAAGGAWADAAVDGATELLPVDDWSQERIAARQEIGRIVAGEDFHQRRTDSRYAWYQRLLDWLDSADEEDEEEESSFVLPGIAELLRFLILIGFFGLAVWLIYANRDRLAELAGRLAPATTTPVLPTTILGMNVSPASLPDDVAAAAGVLWDAGQRRAAMALLYRGSLSALMQQRGIVFASGDTEGDCLRRVSALPGSAIVGFFSGLTRTWTNAAYGGRFPADAEFAALRAGFDQALGSMAEPVEVQS